MRVVPVNPQTIQQQLIRSVFTYLTKQWTALNDVQREAWETARTSEAYYNVTDNFYGVSRKVNSAKSLFVAMNFNVLEATDSLGTPAVTFATPGAPSTQSDFLATSIAADASAGTVALTYSGTMNGNEEIEFWASPPVSPGNLRSTSVKSKMRFVTQNVGVSPAAVGTEYVAKFGAITAATGQKIFWEAYIVNTDTGKKTLAGSGANIVVA